MAHNPENKAEQEDVEVQKVFPPFRSWKQVYALVLLWLLVLIGLFWAFTRYFSP